MPVAWPDDLNQCVLSDGFSEEPERNVVAFRPEVGPPKERRRTSVSSDLVTMPGLVSFEEWELLKVFYRDTLSDGILEFSRTNPVTGESTNYKFTAAPRISQVLGDEHFKIDVRLRRMP